MKFGIFEIIVILLVIFIIFGAGKLPQIIEMFGRWGRDFKKNAAGDTEVEAGKKPKASKNKNLKKAD